MIADSARVCGRIFWVLALCLVSALSHAAPLVMPPCDTDFPEEGQRVASGLWAAMRLCTALLCFARYARCY